MVTYTNKFKAATVQAEPVWFDAAATVEKTIGLIKEAADNNAQIIAFPEVFIPGYPYHIWLDSPFAGMGKFATRYHEQSLPIDSPLITRIQEAAENNNICVVIGFSERDGGSLYMSQLIIDEKGEIVSHRRKLKPTHVERTVYGEGDGSDIAVHDMPLGRVGALNCWEHFQTPTKYAMYAMHEQIHIAAWPGMSLYQPEVFAFSSEAQLVATQMYAMEGQTFVLCSTQVVGKAALEFFCENEMHEKLIGYGGGFAQIFGPDGRPLAERMPADGEGILYAEIDLAQITMAKQAADPVGHYSRPDVFSLQFNNQAQSPVKRLKDIGKHIESEEVFSSVSQVTGPGLTYSLEAPGLSLQKPLVQHERVNGHKES
ncbi:amidohydrolase [Pusillimonas sp. T2]|nr:amidohydrolase [Pusillimonas sp. T2]